MRNDIITGLYPKICQFLKMIYDNLYISCDRLCVIAFTIISYSLYLDWVQVTGEMLDAIVVKATSCEHQYNLNFKLRISLHMLEKYAAWKSFLSTSFIAFYEYIQHKQMNQTMVE